MSLSFPRLPVCALLLGALLLAGCEGGSAVRRALRDPGTGVVFLYLDCQARPSAQLVARVSALRFVSRGGAEHSVEIGRALDAARCAERQMKVAEIALPPGDWVGMAWIFDEARVEEGEETVALTLPEDGVLAQDINLKLRAGEAVALFATWDPDASVSEGRAFAPRFALRGQGMELEDVLAFVTAEESGVVTVIDREQDRVAAVIGVGSEPRGIAASTAKRAVYVANTRSRTISVIDAVAGRVVSTIPNLGEEPWELALSSDGRWLLATNPKSDSVSVIDTVTRSVVRKITVGRRPENVLFDAERGLFYVANRDGGSISVLDAERAEPVRTIRVGVAPLGLAVSNSVLYVADTRTRSISLVDIPTARVTETITNVQSPAWLETGLSDRIYVASLQPEEVAFLYAPMHTVVTRVPTGGRPGRMAVDARLRKLYVAGPENDELYVVDLVSGTMSAVLDVGLRPNGIAVFER
jgi:YVTN family beta-propeller protein